MIYPIVQHGQNRGIVMRRNRSRNFSKAISSDWKLIAIVAPGRSNGRHQYIAITFGW
jgi:hypothetical protein